MMPELSDRAPPVRVIYTATGLYEPWRRLKLTFEPISGNPLRRWRVTCENKETGEKYAAINSTTIRDALSIAERLWMIQTVVYQAATHPVSVVYGPEVAA